MEYHPRSAKYKRARQKAISYQYPTGAIMLKGTGCAGCRLA